MSSRDGTPDQRFLPRVPVAFAPTRAARRATGTLPPLVVLRAPRGFGKTSTAASWLRQADRRNRPVVWVTLPLHAVEAGELWALVHDALAETGHAPRDEPPDRPAVERSLRRMTDRPVLVLDGLHQVSDEDVDAHLVQLVQTCPGLHLIVLTRTERPIERTGPASVDTLVLRAPELALDAGEVADLGQRLGCTLTGPEAQRLQRELVGWPALLRAVLLDASRAADGTLDIDPVSARRYGAAVLHDIDSADYYDLATAAAVRESFTRPELEDLVGKEAVGRAFARLHQAGLFEVTRTSGEPTRYAYTPFIRDVVAQVLRQDDPDRYRRLHSRAAEQCLAVREGTLAFSHAVEAQDWDQAVRIAEPYWTELLTRHGDVLRDALDAMPDRLVTGSARLLVARDHILDEHTTRRAEDVLRSGQLAPGGLLDGRGLTLTERLARRSGEGWSRAAADLVSGRLNGAGTDEAGTVDPWLPEVRRAVPELLLQWAIALLFEEDTVSAAFAFGQAATRAREASDARAEREAATGLALALAVLGHLAPADEWSGYAASLGAPASALETVVRPILAAMTASLRLVPAPARGALEVLPFGPGLEPLEGFVRFVEGARALQAGNHLEAIAQLEAYRRTLGEHPGGITGNISAAVLSDLYVVTEQLDRAAAVLRESSGSGVWLQVSRARYALYVGAHREALRLSAGAASVAAVRPRLAMELGLVRACAALRSGQSQLAVEALHLATSLAADTGMLLPFLYVPRADLDAITESMPNARAFLDRSLAADVEGPFPEPLRSGELSEAELRVFEQLVGNRPLSYIAHRLYLSESTVKTHVRRIYRKLGVSSRADAVARARELSIIPLRPVED